MSTTAPPTAGNGSKVILPSLETPTLTKAELADLLFEHLGLNKRESKDMVDAFFDLIAQSLIAGEDVKLSGFGNFQIRTKAARPGRNPRTGEQVAVTSKRIPFFKTGKQLRDRLNEKPGTAA